MEKCNHLCLVLIFNLFFCSLLFAKQTTSNETHKSKATPTITGKNKVLQLYQLMKDVHEVLISSNIEYWAIAGTLLGAVRHNGLIPWDNDLDICINVKQNDDFCSLKPIFEQLGYYVKSSTDRIGHKIFFKNENNDTLPYPHMDVFVYQQENNKICYSWKSKSEFKIEFISTEFINTNELLPMKDYKFGIFSIKGPNDPFKYLARCYGEKCMDEAYYGRTKKYWTMKLTSKDKTSAMPTGPLQDRVSKILANNQFTLEIIQITKNNLIETQTFLKKLCPVYIEAFEKESEAQLQKEHPEEYNELQHRGLTIKDVLSEKFNKMIDVFISQIYLVKESYISIVKDDIGKIAGYAIFTQAPINQTIQSMISRNYITSVTSLAEEISSLNNQNDDLYILSLAVHPAFQKLGWGKKLISSALDQCSQAKNIYLLTAASEQNMDVQKFYEHLNFKQKGILLTCDKNEKILYCLDTKASNTLK
ncbi:MAG: GNAT family N-acetyltransferase [bacterium]